MGSSGARYEPYIASLGGTGIATPGGSLLTLNSLGATRNTFDDGAGNAVVSANLSVNGTLSPLGLIRELGGMEWGLAHNVTAAYTAGSTATDFVIRADATAGPFTVTLGRISLGSHRVYVVVKIDATANVVTVAPDFGLLGGAASYALNAQGNSVMALHFVTGWDIIGSH